MSGMVRVLLADDHEIMRSGLRALVEGSTGMTVVGEAEDGLQAVAMAHQLSPDVILMDVSMPVLNGVAATERVAAECPQVRVLVLTAHDDREHLTRLLQAGASGYVLKRATSAELVRAIRTVVSGGTYVDPVLAGSLLRDKQSPTDRPQPGRRADGLSEREEEVLRRIAWGESNKEIGIQLQISTKTVETYKTRISEKLGLRTRPEMVRYAVRQGWLADE